MEDPYPREESGRKHFPGSWRRSPFERHRYTWQYRLFAYLRHLWLAEPGVRLRDGEQPSRDEILRMAGELDWTQELDASWEAVRSYNRYCISQAVIDKYNDEAEKKEKRHPRTGVKPQSHALRKEDPGDGKPCREWLLRMEHERWNAYMRVEGFELASTDETAALFDTGQEAHGKNLHRSNIAGLHPCLVGFDQLGDVYVSVDGLYESHGMPENTGNRKTDQRPDDFSLQDDNYLIIGEKEAFFAQEASNMSA